MRKIVSIMLSIIMMLSPVMSLGATGHVDGCPNTGLDTSCCTKTFSITADEGYRVTNVIVNGVSMGPLTSYTFTDITGPQSLKEEKENNNVQNENKEEENNQDENKEDKETENEEEPNMAESNILAFEDDMIGIKFNFDSELYIQKNTQEIFNTLKTVIPEGRTNFNIFTDKLNSTLNICKLTTGKSDGIYINVSVIPFELEKATTTLKIDGTTIIENETIGSVDFNNEELIKNYDTQIKETVQQMGCTIVEYGDSEVREIGNIEKENKKLQGIFTSRIYTGPIEVTTSTGTVDVSQCTIPVGKNAILITAVTDGRPVEIDKTMLLNEIAESFIVTAEIPKEEVEEETEKAE